MAEKMTTVAQLKKAILMGKADSAARIAELAELIAGGLEDVQHNLVTVTLPALEWSGRAQTVNNESFLADSNYVYLIGGDAECLTAYSDAGIRADNITKNGQATFHCEITPENDLTANILRLEVEP